MRVLYFCQYFSTRKGSWYGRPYEFSRRLIERGHEVTMVCGSNTRSATGLEQPFISGRRDGACDGIRVVEFDLNYSNYDGVATRTWKFAKYALRGITFALREDYDLIFCTSTPLTAGLPGIAAATFRRKPFVFEVRDLWPELPKAMGMTNPLLLGAMSALEWASYRSARACIGLAPGIVDGIRARGVDADDTVMIPNGCDLDLFAPKDGARPSIDGIDDDQFVAVFAGAHGRANGLDAVLDAAGELQAKGRDDITLLLIGDGKLKPALEARAKSEGLNNVVFRDIMPKSELAKVMQRADAGLMVLANIEAFYYGTSPNKFFDYISNGLAVINNYPGWLAGLITEHECGVTAAPEDPAAFADALMRLADHPEETKAMGVRARKLAEARFDRRDLADRFVDCLERVLRPAGKADLDSAAGSAVNPAPTRPQR
ncbi:MAG: glycosyltransferase family 4 protein [Alphaproteobacteria bacterium]|nr:glycosyltransferase family 4 protein [Alphaproteobacteria bacterium]